MQTEVTLPQARLLLARAEREAAIGLFDMLLPAQVVVLLCAATIAHLESRPPKKARTKRGKP